MKTTYIYTGLAVAITVAITGSLWYSTGEPVPGGVFAALMLTILVLGWAGGASAQQQPERTPAAYQPAGVPPVWISELCGGELDDLSYGQGYRDGFNYCRAKILAAQALQQPLV